MIIRSQIKKEILQILETIKNEKKAIEDWSYQVEELKKTDVHKELYEELEEKIKNKLRFIEDLEFEALENQIAFEEGQLNNISSSSSSPQSHSMDSDFKSENSNVSTETTNTNGEKNVNNKSPIQLKFINKNYQQEVFWQKPFPINMIINENQVSPSRVDSRYGNEERSMSYCNTDSAYGDTLTQHKTSNRPSSVSSSRCPDTHSPNENDWMYMAGNFNRSQKQSASVRSKNSYQKKNTSRPLTRYLPNPNDPRFNLRSYVEMCGHNLNSVDAYLKIDSHSCYGRLLKLSGKHLKTWKKKSFIFDRNRRMFAYYTSSTSTKVKGMISFDQIVNIHPVSENPSRLGAILSGETHHIFSIQLIDNWNRGRNFKDELILSAPTAECQRAWMDVIFTGAEAYMTTLNANRTDILRNNNQWNLYN